MKIPARVKAWLDSDHVEMARARKSWLVALDPLKEHCDTALILGLILLKEGSLDQAVVVLCDIADGLEPNSWSQVYLRAFEELLRQSFLRKLGSSSIVRLLNATGLCQSRLRRWADAEETFLRLRRYSLRKQDVWGIGQAYINGGVVFFNRGEMRKAEALYRLAVSHAETHRDKWLLGRSLHNLGLTLLRRDPENAVKAIARSIALKAKTGDIAGAIGGMLATSHLHKAESRESLRRKILQRAAILAIRHDRRHLHCLVLLELASVEVGGGNLKEAWDYFGTGRRIATEERFRGLERDINYQEAISRFGAGSFARAGDLFEKVLGMVSPHEREFKLSVTHDIGVTQMKMGKMREAREALQTALALAKEVQSQAWISRCRHAESMTYTLSVDGLDQQSALRRFAEQEAQDGRQESATKLWLVLFSRLLEQAIRGDEVDEVAKAALRCAEKSGDRHLQIRANKAVFVWRRELGDTQGALHATNELVRLTRGNEWVEEHVRALDEKAVCLQRLGQYSKAEPIQRRALGLALQAKLLDCVYTALNNLGELLRKTDRVREALSVFAKLFRQMSFESNPAMWISSSINYALTLGAAGQTQEANKLLGVCETRAYRLGVISDVIRARHTRANIAWKLAGDAARARVHYQKALTIDRLHGALDVGLALNFTTFALERLKEPHVQRRTNELLKLHAFASGVCDAYNLAERKAELLVAMDLLQL